MVGNAEVLLKALRHISGLKDYADELAAAGMVDFAHRKALGAASENASKSLKEYFGEESTP